VCVTTFTPSGSCPPPAAAHSPGARTSIPSKICCDDQTCDSSCATKLPQGTVCGLVDSDNSVDDFCGMAHVLSNGCPSGYDSSFGAYDAGRPAGHGLKWCWKR
jgi:hypothetical protein